MSTAAAFNAMATAYGVTAAAAFPDTVTFMRPTNTVDSVGGFTTVTAATTPANVPCRWRELNAAERTVVDKRISGANYAIFIPGQFTSALPDLDAKCDVVMAARASGEPSRTFKTHGVLRYEGLEIKILASLEE